MATEDTPDTPLFRLYRRYLGEPEAPRDVYLGFALFFGGIILGAIGLGLFLWSGTIPFGEPAYWQFREIAIGFASIGLPVFVLSVVVLLPVDRRTIYAGGAGLVVCLAALGIFVYAYPSQWNVSAGTDYSVQGILVYAVGVTVIAGSTGAALVGHHLERARPEPAAEAAESGDAEEESISQARIEEDIEAALEESDLTWGGVERDRGRRLEFDTENLDDIDDAHVTEETVTTARSEGVDDAVAGLQRLQGTPKTARGSGTDDQVNALTEFREGQTEDDDAEDGIERGVIERFKRLFG